MHASLIAATAALGGLLFGYDTTIRTDAMSSIAGLGTIASEIGRARRWIALPATAKFYRNTVQSG